MRVERGGGKCWRRHGQDATRRDESARWRRKKTKGRSLLAPTFFVFWRESSGRCYWVVLNCLFFLPQLGRSCWTKLEFLQVNNTWLSAENVNGFVLFEVELLAGSHMFSWMFCHQTSDNFSCALCVISDFNMHWPPVRKVFILFRKNLITGAEAGLQVTHSNSH